MSSNKNVKEEMIRLYGAECFIDKLHLRPENEKVHYKGKAQRKRMLELTYHHILERSKGGKATIENGAILSATNHQWFNKQSKEKQAEMNAQFQEYKRKVKFGIAVAELTVDGIEQSELLEIESDTEKITIPLIDNTPEDYEKYQKYLAERFKKEIEKPKWKYRLEETR